MSLTITAIVAAGVLALLYYVFATTRPSKPLPPGPKPYPLIGNLLDMPDAEHSHAYYTKLGHKYGPISSLSVFGTTLIIVNDYHVARELLDKRANIYSDRPVMPMLGNLMGVNNSMLLTQAGPRLTRLRKISHNQLGSVTAVARWAKEVDVEVRRYLYRTMVQPDKFVDHLRRQAATVILKIIYGYEVNPGADRLLTLSEEFTDAVIQTAVPGAYLVDAMPILQYVPEWFPGAGFKREAKSWRKVVIDMADVPYQFTKAQVKEGDAPQSVVAETIVARDKGQNEFSDNDIAWSGTSMLGGGADTTMASMEMLFLAMIKNPEVLKEAQKEIDEVVGLDRFVEEQDRANMPYTDALFKETMRWQPLLEMNMPHCASEDDIYEEYFIPKGALILTNTTGFMHDSNIYAEPEKFDPRRFMGDKPEMSPFELLWGHGRRVCPGRHFAYFTLWLEISRTLQVFDIKAVEGDPPSDRFTWGVIRRPLPYRADIKIRSAEHEKLVRSIELEHPSPTHGSKLPV